MSTSQQLFVIHNSKIHRRGGFALVDIPKGTRIIEYKGEKITKAESERRALDREARARRGGHARVFIFELNKRYDLDGGIKDNVAKYINHSCEANCEAENIRGKIWLVALRDIKAGEELSFDYGYDLANFRDHPCYCGTASCLGYIVRKDQRWRLRKMLGEKARKSVKKTASSKKTKSTEPNAKKL